MRQSYAIFLVLLLTIFFLASAEDFNFSKKKVLSVNFEEDNAQDDLQNILSVFKDSKKQLQASSTKSSAHFSSGSISLASEVEDEEQGLISAVKNFFTPKKTISAGPKTSPIVAGSGRILYDEDSDDVYVSSPKKLNTMIAELALIFSDVSMQATPKPVPVADFYDSDDFPQSSINSAGVAPPSIKLRFLSAQLQSSILFDENVNFAGNFKQGPARTSIKHRPFDEDVNFAGNFKQGPARTSIKHRPFDEDVNFAEWRATPPSIKPRFLSSSTIAVTPLAGPKKSSVVSSIFEEDEEQLFLPSGASRPNLSVVKAPCPKKTKQEEEVEE